MGEIRVKVLLSNATDAALSRMKKLAKKKIRTYEALRSLSRVRFVR